MTQPAPTQAVIQYVPSVQRVKVFVDFWNFKLSMDDCEAHHQGVQPGEVRVEINWWGLGEWLAKKAAELAKIQSHQYEGVHIYASYDPAKLKDKGFHKWITDLNRKPGIHVECLERKKRGAPNCPVCHQPVERCPHCTAEMVGTSEKGVDAFLVTDMIRLAWEGAYDVAVVASSDRDLIPAADYLETKGKKVIQAAFSPKGEDLGKACWGVLDIQAIRKEIYRAEPNIHKLERGAART